MKKLSILIADDNEVNQDLLSAYLKPYPIKLYYVSNGLQAIDFFEKFPELDLVLMDLNMPVLNGFEALHRIKKCRPAVPVIAITGYPWKYSMDETVYAGFDAYLEKPLTSRLLISAIASLLPDEGARIIREIYSGRTK